MAEQDVIIIGGGLAGLSCALALVDQGLRVIVLEQAALLGGRASSWMDEQTGDTVSIGPHILLNQYHNMLRLLDRLGTREQVVWEADGRFLTLVEGQHEVVIRNSLLPPPYHFVPSLLRDPAIGVRDFVSNWPVVKLALELDEAALLKFDTQNARDFLLGLGVTERFIQRFWQFTALAIMNVPLEQASATALLRFYRRLIGYRNLAIGFPAGGLSDLYVPQACAVIEQAGGTVLTAAEVSRLLVEVGPGGKERVSGVALADGKQLLAHYCVSTVPPDALRRIIPPAWRAQHQVFADLEEFAPVPYLSVYLWFDRKLTPRQFWARVHADNDLNCDFYDLSNIYPGWQTRPSLIASNIINVPRAATLDDASIIQLTVAELAEYLPQALQACLLHSVVHRIPLAIPIAGVGSETRRPTARTPIEGLFLAGDWVQTQLPYSMESAVASGWLAAEQILAEIGKPQQLVAPLPVVEQSWWISQLGRVWPDKSAAGRGE